MPQAESEGGGVGGGECDSCLEFGAKWRCSCCYAGGKKPGEGVAQEKKRLLEEDEKRDIMFGMFEPSQYAAGEADRRALAWEPRRRLLPVEPESVAASDPASVWTALPQVSTAVVAVLAVAVAVC